MYEIKPYLLAFIASMVLTHSDQPVAIGCSILLLLVSGLIVRLRYEYRRQS